MAQFVNMRKVDLLNGEPAVFSLRQLYYADQEANKIGAIVFMGGEPYALAGTCTGTAIRADGTTVPMQGTVDGNQAYITLIPDCYAIEGNIQIFVKITIGDVVATLAAAVGTVRLTETNAVIDPGEIIPSVSALITSINDAIASIPADYSDLLAAIAPNYADLVFPVTAGTWCWHEGDLYRAKVDIPASETWTAAHWETAPLSNALAGDIADLKSTLETVEGAAALGSDTLLPLAWESGSLSTTDGSEEADVSRRRTDYIPVTAGSIYVTYESPVSGFMVFWYDASKNYISGSRTSWVNSSGSTVAMNASGVYYRILAKRSSPPTPLTADEIRPFKVLIAPIWDKDIFDGMQSIAKEYNTASGGYSVGEYCTHTGKMYVCISPVSQGDAWAAEKWQETDAGAELKQANADIAALESANLDAASVFQKYDATMAAIIKNFKMQSNEYKYIVISDIRRNYNNTTGFTVYYYDNDTFATAVRHTLMTVRELSSTTSNSFSRDFDNGGFIQFDFDVSGQADGYRNTGTNVANRIKPSVIQPLIGNYVSAYGLDSESFMAKSGSTPIFTWIDDDTDPTGVTRVKAICDTLGIKATFACVTNKLAENSGALATTLLGYQQAGFHITSHSHTHTKGTENDPFWYPTDYTDVALSEADLIESLTTLNDYGFLDSNLFVTPGGNRNAALLKMISKWCPCVIGANGGANHKFGTGRTNINRIFIRPESEGGETLQTYKDMIDAAVTAGDWLIFGTHSGIPAQWDETLVNEVLSYALTKNAEFATLNQAWQIRKYNYDLYDMFT